MSDLRTKVALAVDSAKRTKSRREAQQEMISCKEREAKEAQHLIAERDKDIAALRKEISDLRAVIESNRQLAEERNAAVKALEMHKQVRRNFVLASLILL